MGVWLTTADEQGRGRSEYPRAIRSRQGCGVSRPAAVSRPGSVEYQCGRSPSASVLIWFHSEGVARQSWQPITSKSDSVQTAFDPGTPIHGVFYLTPLH